MNYMKIYFKSLNSNKLESRVRVGAGRESWSFKRFQGFNSKGGRYNSFLCPLRSLCQQKWWLSLQVRYVFTLSRLFVGLLQISHIWLILYSHKRHSLIRRRGEDIKWKRLKVGCHSVHHGQSPSSCQGTYMPLSERQKVL